MELQWERRHNDLYLAFSSTPHRQQLAQVAHVFGPDGDDHGWSVWLTMEQGELFDRYHTVGEAMKAAEAAVAP